MHPSFLFSWVNPFSMRLSTWKRSTFQWGTLSVGRGWLLSWGLRHHEGGVTPGSQPLVQRALPYLRKVTTAGTHLRSGVGLSHPRMNWEFGLLRQKSLGLYLRYLDSCGNSWIVRVRESKVLFRSSVSLHSDPLQKLFGKFLLKSANRFQITKTASPMQKFIKTHRSHRDMSILQRCYYH